MKILSMTATFGKLEHETLTLQPGLNIIEAPNEWGKSTWCAFMTAMFYGIDTRERTTQESLADKERYAPWSGVPMSGRMELCWNGRNITIERSSKGRSIFGVFRAYETDTGLDIPELTAANCGEMLLGVEKSVFLRAGFLKLTDLPVTEDAALWRRLNALVTTTDESGASDTLAQKLKDLKNQCMSNRSNGLIPQLLRQKQELEGDLSQLRELKAQHRRLEERQQQLETWHAELSNHQAALAYEAAQSNAQRLEQARFALTQAQEQLERLERLCADYPQRRTLEQQEQQLKELLQESASVQLEIQMLPPAPQPPQVASVFRDLSPEEAAAAVRQDTLTYTRLQQDKLPITLSILGVICAAASIIGIALKFYLAAALLIPSAVLIAMAVARGAKNKKLAQQLVSRYGNADPESWTQLALDHAGTQKQYLSQYQQWQTNREYLQQRQAALQEKAKNFSSYGSLQEAGDYIRQRLRNLDELDSARRELIRSENHAKTMESLAAPVKAPEAEDHLTHTKEQTDRLLADCTYEQRQVERELARCGAQMDALGEEEALTGKLSKLDGRLTLLRQTYDALELAQKTLSSASEQLQRRFAPRISQRAQAIFGKLTNDRYTRLTLDKNLGVQVGAENEVTLRESRWRSDGTIDQLYLALRLAVAEELTPDAPLVLDDALVRFDDTRVQAAIRILQETAENKQVLLFSCQSREKNILSSN